MVLVGLLMLNIIRVVEPISYGKMDLEQQE